MVDLQIWDTSGQDMYKNLTSIYYRDAHAAVMVFDFTNPASLDNLKFWLEELDDRVNTNDITIKIVGNKFDLIDQCERKLEDQDIKAALSDFDTSKFEIVRTSAVTGQNIANLFGTIAEDCYKRHMTK